MKCQIKEGGKGSVIMMKIMLAASEDEEENDDECGEGGVEAEWNCNHAGDGSHTCSDTRLCRQHW